ncbi:MAG: hypothetical protein AB8G05_23985 [Oligoflexales bacterium]
MVKNKLVLISFSLLLSFYIFGCGGDHECDLSGNNNLQMDENGVFICKKEPGLFYRKDTNVKIYNSTQCTKKDYKFSIEEQLIRCTNDFGDLSIEESSQGIVCLSSNIGKWIMIEVAEYPDNIFYLQCNSEHYISVSHLDYLNSNNQSSDIYINCPQGQVGIFSNDRSDFNCG